MAVEINALVAAARRRFRAAGVPHDEAALDARLLAQYLLGWDAARLLTHGEETAPAGFEAAYENLVARRVAREPLAYITGLREFWNLDIEVTPAVLVPRPETELLIETALDEFGRAQPLGILDLCTGSGCVAIGLAREFPRARVLASDISRDALAIAGRNVARHGLTGRVRLICADLFAGISAQFDLIVANPPYVPLLAAPQLPPEVRQFEPPAALFAGQDGLQVIRRLAGGAAGALRDDGVLIFEFGAGQVEAVEALIATVPSLTLLDIRHDLQDIPRAAVVRKASSVGDAR